MPDLPTGWDSPLSRLFDFFEGLLRVLKAIGPGAYRGEGRGFRFQLNALAGRLELHVQEAEAATAELFIADARRSLHVGMGKYSHYNFLRGTGYNWHHSGLNRNVTLTLGS